MNAEFQSRLTSLVANVLELWSVTKRVWTCYWYSRFMSIIKTRRNNQSSLLPTALKMGLNGSAPLLALFLSFDKATIKTVSTFVNTKEEQILVDIKDKSEVRGFPLYNTNPNLVIFCP